MTEKSKIQQDAVKTGNTQPVLSSRIWLESFYVLLSLQNLIEETKVIL